MSDPTLTYAFNGWPAPLACQNPSTEYPPASRTVELGRGPPPQLPGVGHGGLAGEAAFVHVNPGHFAPRLGVVQGLQARLTRGKRLGVARAP